MKFTIYPNANRCAANLCYQKICEQSLSSTPRTENRKIESILKYAEWHIWGRFFPHYRTLKTGQIQFSGYFDCTDCVIKYSSLIAWMSAGWRVIFLPPSPCYPLLRTSPTLTAGVWKWIFRFAGDGFLYPVLCHLGSLHMFWLADGMLLFGEKGWRRIFPSPFCIVLFRILRWTAT